MGTRTKLLLARCDVLEERSKRQRGIRMTKMQKVGSTLFVICVSLRDKGDKYVDGSLDCQIGARNGWA